jgi:predicted secreted protein
MNLLFFRIIICSLLFQIGCRSSEKIKNNVINTTQDTSFEQSSTTEIPSYNSPKLIVAKVKKIDILYSKVGDTLLLNLPAHFNTGFLWSIFSKDTSLILVKKTQARTKNDIQIFHFTAIKPGAYSAVFKYQRPFDSDSIFPNSVMKQFEFK